MSNAGRPSDFKPELIEQAVAICSVTGATNVQLAKIFGVCEATIYNWCNQHPEFLEAIRGAKEKHDNALVERSLLQRATGYTHDDEHISNYKGKITRTKIKKHYPPDVAAIQWWQKNRDPDRWKDKQHIDHSGTIGISITEDEANL